MILTIHVYLERDRIFIRSVMCEILIIYVTPFHTTGLFLYRLKYFEVFRGYKTSWYKTSGMKWVKQLVCTCLKPTSQILYMSCVARFSTMYTI